MAWIYLGIASIFEIGFAISLKLTDGFTQPRAIASLLACMAISLYTLSLAMKQIPLGTAYTIWTGVGALGTVTLGIVLFNDPVTFWRLFFTATLIVSVAGLKLVSGN